MDKKIFTVAIIGCGSRGLDSYAMSMVKHGGFKIAAACDIRQVKLDLAMSEYGVAEENCFLDENDFFKKKLADVCIVATQDRDHVRHAIMALRCGYDVLCEKPISPSKEECKELLRVQKETGKIVIVCHVLRYAQSYLNTYRMIKEGKIGRLIDIHAIEQVTYWHIAHSYVRGNWRREEETSPMILAKCCHDLDLLQWYAGSKCKSVSSIGDLAYFKKENQPEGASDRCQNCKYKTTCPYSAEVYIKRWKDAGSPESMWPANVVSTDRPLTEEGIRKAYENNQYGRCVFACDNDVVDHQETNILFENGVTANLCMTGFTGDHGRVYRFHGTMGEIDLDEERGEIVLKEYSKPKQVIPFSELPDVSGGHGGGDMGLVNALYEALLSGESTSTTLEASVESHLMSFAAETSRLKEGESIKIHK
ncbi:MAG: Gfo/Idh/MocA family oxidoreductase [Bacilli bacterium]|nr:Gfo/Idh/MocA family oxidoreductase [Bacilli bacterium]